MNYPTENNHRGVDTSREAAEAIAPKAARYRYLVHKLLFDHPNGLTVDEVCAKAGHPRFRLQPRFSDLRRLGMIRDTGARRFNVSGARAIVWRATVLDRIEAQGVATSAAMHQPGAEGGDA